MKKTNGLRTILISGQTRQQLINFILRKDSSYSVDNFAELSDKQVRQIALSVDKKAQADRQQKKIRKMKSHKLKSVLLIDDNEIDNFINQKVLESCGATDILTFTNTTTALQHLQQTKDAPRHIFLDIRFPIMDGFEFIDKLDKLEIARQQLDIFILTCSINPADRQKAKEKNCAGFIDKPLTEEKLLQLLDTTTTK